MKYTNKVFSSKLVLERSVSCEVSSFDDEDDGENIGIGFL